jgi:hypothetical protein
MSEVAKEYVWHMQRVILDALVVHKKVAVKSCHSSGKSHITSRMVGYWLDPRVHSLGSAFSVTTAPSAPQVKAILWRYIRQLHNRAKLPGRVTLECEWHMNEANSKYRIGDPSEELIAMGRKPADYDENSLQGIHARYVLGVIDEANGVPKQLFDAMLAITTNDDSRVIAIGNPDDPASHFAEICKPGSGWHVISIPAWITPNVSHEFAASFGMGYENQRAQMGVEEEELPEDVAAVLLSENWVRERANDWGVGSPLWQSRVCAEFPDVSDESLISPALMQKAYETEQPGLEQGQYGLDVSRYGTDKTVMYWNRGFQIRHHKSWVNKDTEETADIVHAELSRHKTIFKVPVNIDAIGIGSGVYDKLKRKLPIVRAIYGSEKARNAKRFKNRRAEIYWTFRQLMDDRVIDLDPKDETLAAQLTSIKWWEDAGGRIQIESKEEMRERGMPSPNEADACVYSIVKHGSTKEEAIEEERRKKDRQKKAPVSMTADLLNKVM